MQEEDYRAWMVERGDQHNTVNTSIGTINSLVSRLEALDLPADALARAAIPADFEKVDQVLQNPLSDLKDGGERYRLVAPNTAHPTRSLHNIRSHLRKYRRFVLGEEQT